MARLPRVVVTQIPHHITQRGNACRFILDRDADREVYLECCERIWSAAR